MSDKHEYNFTMIIPADEVEVLEAVFPGGNVMASHEAFLNSGFENFVNNAIEAFQRRRDTAISGAMRWPWSQEYPIYVPRVKF